METEFMNLKDTLSFSPFHFLRALVRNALVEKGHLKAGYHRG